MEATSGGEYMVSPQMGTIPRTPRDPRGRRRDFLAGRRLQSFNLTGDELGRGVSVLVLTLLVLDDVDGSLLGG